MPPGRRRPCDFRPLEELKQATNVLMKPMSCAALACVVLMTSACRETAIIPGADVQAVLERIAVSKIRTPQDISPYDDALSWQEYKVVEVRHGKIESPVIRVAHWTVSGGKQVPTDVDLGERVTLSLNLFDEAEGLDGVPKEDDLDLLESPPRFLAMLSPDHPASQPKALRYDYQGHFSEQMKLYWNLRPQLRLVIMGNSHATKGISPRFLLGAENQTTPQALNLAPPGANNDMQCVVIEDYVLPLPKLETVVWVISGRNFNLDRNEGRKLKEFLASPGREHDELGKEEHWPIPPESKPVTIAELDALNLKQYDSWGWNERGKGEMPLPSEPERLKEYIDQELQPVSFEWNEASWQKFTKTVKKLNDRGVRVFVLTTPMHPVMANLPPADVDGTGDDGFAQLVAKATELDAALPLTSFYDYNELEKHDFQHSEFFDLDHLNKHGAPRLTQKIAEWIDETLAKEVPRPTKAGDSKG